MFNAIGENWHLPSENRRKKCVEMYLLDVLPNPPIPKDVVAPHSCGRSSTVIARIWEPKSITVPKCLESHMIYINIEGYQGFEDQQNQEINKKKKFCLWGSDLDWGIRALNSDDADEWESDSDKKNRLFNSCWERNQFHLLFL